MCVPSMRTGRDGGNGHFSASPRPPIVTAEEAGGSTRGSARGSVRGFVRAIDGGGPMAVDYAVIIGYLAGMLAVGWWGMRRARSKSDFLVAGRRLGPSMYSGTMA